MEQDQKSEGSMEVENDGESAIRVRQLKMAKSRTKAVYTRYKNQLLQLLEDEETTKLEIRELSKKLDSALERAMDAIHGLSDEFVSRKEYSESEMMVGEMDSLERNYDDVVKQVTEYFDMNRSVSSISEVSSIASNHSETASCEKIIDDQVKKMEKTSDGNLGQDMWKQMKRISIPTFSGSKRQYEPWKAAFMACIDGAPATREYKLLQLKQYLGGEALKTIENLGHSATAYSVALERLERKYGGERRKVARYLEDLESFPPIKEENAKTMEKFADLLDIAVLNLAETNHYDDLKNGSLYVRLQKKLSEGMLTRYHRWIFENKESESVLTLRRWIIQEAEYFTIASEMIQGLSVSSDDRARNRRQQSYFVKSKDAQKNYCQLCKLEGHSIWNCSEFRNKPVNRRWDIAKQLQLCFRCFGVELTGGSCKRTQLCGIKDCGKTHNRLLHVDPVHKVTSDNSVRNPAKNEMVHTSTCAQKQGNSEQKYIALRTVPVVVTYGNKYLQINALLDDGSTKTYINEDVACELGVNSLPTEVTVNVLNGKTDTFQTMPVRIGLDSINGHVKMHIDANTTRNVTGTLKAINWNEKSQEYSHLRGIKFPQINKRYKVDMLIGSDYAELHFSLHEVKGEPGQPVARLTPLGWTCVGPYENSGENICFNTYFVTETTGLNELNSTLKQFWEIDSSGTFNKSEDSLSVNETLILERTEKSVQYDNFRYSVGIPWKQKDMNLPNNYSSALKRLENTEKKLVKNPKIYSEYRKIFKEHEKKGYVTKVLPEKAAEKGWYLPHFPVTRMDKATTKVRVVFDASAKCEGVSLNDNIEQGPKLQTELFNVLLRFRKHEVALICDIQEMYLRVGILETDRKYHRFLWRDSPDLPPSEYEFNRVVFGVNASPFLAQLVSQMNARENRNTFPLAAETVLKSTYMDDSMDSVPTEEQGVELYRQLSSLWNKAGMHARKWLSNSTAVLEQIPKNDRLYETDISEKGLPAVKTLGVLWIADKDVFSFIVNKPSANMTLTKRTFLGTISTLFDPLGFLAPYTVRAKIMMQDLWLTCMDWDDVLKQDECLKV